MKEKEEFQHYKQFVVIKTHKIKEVMAQWFRIDLRLKCQLSSKNPVTSGQVYLSRNTSQDYS